MAVTKDNKPTDSATRKSAKRAALLAAAIALPAINQAHAETAPERGSISLKYLDYLDSQPGDDRIKVSAPSVNVMMPIAGAWTVSGTYTSDSISGASPAFHTRTLVEMEDLRRAIDLKLTRYLPRGTITVGTSYSKETDYLSRGYSVQGTLSTEDKNTTFNAGIGISNDDINPSNKIVVNETKQVMDYILGVTQVLTTRDIVQLNLGYSAGKGYFSDPYKTFDQRPRGHDHATLLARWNHHFDQTDGTSHLSYRYYTDNYGVDAHTVEAEYIQPLAYGWTLQPLARYYTQTAADFYVEVDPAQGQGITFPSPEAKYNSRDQRLSAYGAVTLGFKVIKQLGTDWTVDFKYENYEQKGSWAINSGGSFGLDTFRFRSYQFGLSRKF
jgi:hypothetical protein